MRALWAGLSVLWALAVLVVSVLPPPAIQGPDADYLHAGPYFVLVVLAYLGWRRDGASRWANAGGAWMAAMAWGLAIEVAQIFVPRHGWEWVDLGWNGVGGLAGAILCVALPVRSLAVGRS